LVNTLRFEIGSDSTRSESISDARTIRVLDAFSSGGAQIHGGRRVQQLELENEFEFSFRRTHQLSGGLNINGTHADGDEFRNAAGTFTFASLEDFSSNRPTSFTQRIGDPRFDYSLYRFGWYVQDDYRVRRNLMLSVGFRHDLQTRLSDWRNFSPRVGINWTPDARWRTTLRASVRKAYQPFDAGLYQQMLVVNGEQQRDLVIVDPGFPDPFADGIPQAARPPSIVRAGAHLVMPSTTRLRLGVDQPLFGRSVTIRATYAHDTGHDLFRSRNANAAVNGIRPHPGVGTISELESSARSSNRSLELSASVRYPARRMSGNIRYVLGEAQNETDGALTLPPDSFDLSSEWGPSRQDIRHRFNASFYGDLWAGFRLNAGYRALSAPPYTITTGEDVNGDGVNNERPAGFGRNSARGAATRNLDVTLTWGVNLGQRARNTQGDRRSSMRGRSDTAFGFEVYARASNVLNDVNPRGFSGVVGSRFFGHPTSAGAARRLVFGTRIRF
jgi:hypothetical protein